MQMTPEELDRYILERQRQQRREYNKRHPEIIMQQRIRAACNFLRKNGFTVTEPKKESERVAE